MLLCERLELLREKNDWNKSEVARKLNIPQTTYIAYENGKYEPNIDRLIAMADLYKVSVDYLIGHEEEKTDFVMPREIINISQARYFLKSIHQLENKMSDDELLKFTQALLYFVKKK